jgi:predicted small integral membrane protein
MLRITKILLVLSVALWGVLGALGNVEDWKGTTGAVAAVASMSTFLGGAERWQATTNPLIIGAAAACIVLFKIATAGLCLAGASRMWERRKGDAGTFGEAKGLALAGCGVAVLGLFVGWIVLGEGWFEFWRSDALRESAGGGAFRYGGCSHGGQPQRLASVRRSLALPWRT